MILLHLTEKLRRRLGLPKSALASTASAAAGPDGVDAHAALRWYGNTFETRGTSYLLTTNAASLYSVVLEDKEIDNSDAYMHAFLRALRVQLAADGLDTLYDQKIAPSIGTVVLKRTADRSVLGTMKLMVQECEIGVHYIDATAAELSARINGSIYNANHRSTPRAAFARFGSQTLDPDIQRHAGLVPPQPDIGRPRLDSIVEKHSSG